jgi:hypothetical protein
MKSRLKITGDELNISTDISLEQLQKIVEALDVHLLPSEDTGWEKPQKEDESAYYTDMYGKIQKMEYSGRNKENIDLLYENVNCYTSAILARNIQRGEKLVRELRRFAVEKRKNPIDFSSNGGYTIAYNHLEKTLEVGATGSWVAVGDVVFDTEEAAREAICTYGEELIWYFTERKDTF